MISPLGYRSLLRRAGLTRIVELDWWESHPLAPRRSPSSAPTPSAPQITLTPAQHWSNRLSGTRCGRLWGGFFVTSPARRVFFAVDTGYHPHLFKDIGQRLGPPDLSLLPIGAYEPRWFMAGQHVNPSEAVQIHRDLGSHRSIGMHWGTFQLTDEACFAPVESLQNCLADPGIPPVFFTTTEPGQPITV